MFMKHSANEKYFKQQEPFWLQPSCIIKIAYSLQKSEMPSWGSVATTVLYHPWQKYFWRLSTVLEAPIFVWIALEHDFRKEHVFTLGAKLCQMQPYIPKVWITKPAGSQTFLNHSKQWAISSLSPRFNFFFSALKGIIRGSKRWPVTKGTSHPSTGSLHSRRMLLRDLSEQLARKQGAPGL